ncbi:MAG: type II secretion system F family protein [Propionibacteriaceae bacterium]|nr:type II secretion system F family protein [Propionibacteriaceae bacterium]
MNAALFGLCAAVAAAGLFTLIVAMITDPAPASGSTVRTLGERVRRTWCRLPVGRRRLIIAALIIGVIAYVITLWVPILVIVPAPIIALPLLLADPPNHRIEMLEALDRWVRALAASIPTGKSIPDALQATRAQAPGPLAEPVLLLAQRLAQRWGVPDALRALADDCDSPDVDAVAAALIVASDRGGLGATATLEALADSIQDRLAAARDIETERAKPRIVVRQVTGIIVAVIIVVLITSPDYFASYRTGFGPLIMAGLIAIFLGSLFRLRMAGVSHHQARILMGRIRDEVGVPQ